MNKENKKAEYIEPGWGPDLTLGERLDVASFPTRTRASMGYGQESNEPQGLIEKIEDAVERRRRNKTPKS